MIDLRHHIRTVPDFPKPGILFYDIGTLLANGPAWQATIDQLVDIITPLKPDKLVGIESRGFLVTAPVAARMGIGFAMVRKKNKLPGKTLRHDYVLEYGTDTLEIQEGMINPGERIVICDDLLATGGTVAAATHLIEKVGGKVIHGVFMIELTNLGGRAKMGVPATSLMQAEG